MKWICIAIANPFVVRVDYLDMYDGLVFCVIRSVGWVLCGETCPHGLSPRLGTGACIFLDLFYDLTALCFQW